MLPTRALSILLLAPFCAQALGEESTATQDCLDLAGRSLEGNPQLEQRWQRNWLDAQSIRVHAYDGEIEGRRAGKRLQADMRQGEKVDGQLRCYLADDGQAISAQFTENADAP